MAKIYENLYRDDFGYMWTMAAAQSGDPKLIDLLKQRRAELFKANPQVCRIDYFNQELYDLIT